MKIKTLIGSGDKIMLTTLPFLVVGLVLNFFFPSVFSVGGPPLFLVVISIVMLVAGVATWLWTVILILTKVPKGKLITNGPFAVVKHPLYTAIALLVIPAIGFLLNSWLGIVIGIVMYIAVKIYAPAEEKALAETFGPAWDDYSRKVLVPWL